MFALLKFIFVFLLIAFLLVLLMVAAVVLRMVGSVRKAFRMQGGQQQNNSGRHYDDRQESFGTEERVIDRRNPQKANRKIFTENEGEYVDFEES